MRLHEIKINDFLSRKINCLFRNENKKCQFLHLYSFGCVLYLSYIFKLKRTDWIQYTRVYNLITDLIQPLTLNTRECAMKPSEMASLENSRWHNRKERPNQSTYKGNMDEKAKRL